MQKQQDECRRQQDERMEENKKLMELLLQSLQQKQETTATAVPALPGFDPTAELLTVYIDRFNTFIAANSIHQDKIAGTFLINQQPTLYKQLSDMVAFQHPRRSTTSAWMKYWNFLMTSMTLSIL